MCVWIAIMARRSKEVRPVQLKPLLCFLCAFLAARLEAFTIGIPEYLYHSREQEQFEQGFTALYSRIGIHVSFVYLPLSRMQLMAAQQQLDAIAYQISTQIPVTEMIRVPEPLSRVQLMAACPKRCAFDVDTKVVVVNDAILARRFCQSLALSCLQVSGPESAKKVLQSGLADMHIMQWSPHIAQPCPTDYGYQLHPIADTQVEVYHYVAPEHEALVTELAAALRHMKKHLSQKANTKCMASVGPEIVI